RTNWNLYYREPWSTFGLSPWLWFTGVAAAIAAITVVRRLRKQTDEQSIPGVLFAAELWFAVALFAYLQFGRHFAVLGTPYYASMLLPAVFLVIGSLFWKNAEQISGTTYAWSCGIAAAAFALIWSDYAGSWTPMWPQAIVPAAAAGVAMLA